MCHRRIGTVCNRRALSAYHDEDNDDDVPPKRLAERARRQNDLASVSGRECETDSRGGRQVVCGREPNASRCVGLDGATADDDNDDNRPAKNERRR